MQKGFAPILIVLIISFVINIAVAGLLLVYLFTSQLDTIAINISGPRLCQVLQQYQPNLDSTRLFCGVLGEGIYSKVDKQLLKSLSE